MIETRTRRRVLNGVLLAAVALVVAAAAAFTAFELDAARAGHQADDAASSAALVETGASFELVSGFAAATDAGGIAAGEADEASDSAGESDAAASSAAGEAFSDGEGETVSAEFGAEGALDAESAEGNAEAPFSSGTSTPTCTIEIRCDAILANLGNLVEGKDAYVPADGTILALTQVELQEGDTAFSVLERICRERDIQLEYLSTPIYGSYYVEGIANLYQFDCGSQSGWMFKVNGVFPQYGASASVLADGDTVLWCYTCTGTGADLGS